MSEDQFNQIMAAIAETNRHIDTNHTYVVQRINALSLQITDVYTHISAIHDEISGIKTRLDKLEHPTVH
jgi:tetrahydromethanopterin S-methyltransferase subunit G